MAIKKAPEGPTEQPLGPAKNIPARVDKLNEVITQVNKISDGDNLTVPGDITITGNLTVNGNTTLANALTDTVAIAGTLSGTLTFEGTTDDAFEIVLDPGEPSGSDKTITLPNITGTVIVDAGAQSIGGAKTFTDPITQNDTTNQIVLGVTNTTTISATAPAASRVLTIPDPGGAASFVMTEGAQTVNGAKTLGSQIIGVAGSAAAPSFAPGIATMGIYESSATELGLSTEGTFRGRISSVGLEIAAAHELSTPKISHTASLIISMATPTVGTGFDGALVTKWIPYGTFGVSGPKVTEFIFDLTNLVNSTTASDIIGETATANCNFGQITEAIHGTVFAMEIICLETPAGGDPDIDFYSATEATGTENNLVTGLTETLLLARGASWAIDDRKSVVTALPIANQYLYLAVGSAGGAPGTYSAGKFKIKFYGV